MTFKDIQGIIPIQHIEELPQSIMDLLNSPERDKYFDAFVKLNPDPSFDWFQKIYEQSLSHRKSLKQDFTPKSIASLISAMMGVPSGVIYEPTAGTGSLIIVNWAQSKATAGEQYKTEDYPIYCWELSNTAIPFLLFNLSIRGMVGVVVHGNTLTRQIFKQYALSKDASSSTNYSKITSC